MPAHANISYYIDSCIQLCQKWYYIYRDSLTDNPVRVNVDASQLTLFIMINLTGMQRDNSSLISTADINSVTYHFTPRFNLRYCSRIKRNITDVETIYWMEIGQGWLMMACRRNLRKRLPWPCVFLNRNNAPWFLLTSKTRLQLHFFPIYNKI